MARGQCVEHCGEGRAVPAPRWTRWGSWAAGQRGQELLAVLRRYAPMWLTQLPGLVSEPELRAACSARCRGRRRRGCCAECAEALAALTVDTPLVLVLEDLHWSDHSTIECLTAVAQRREPARLLVLGTYRPVETVLRRASPARAWCRSCVGGGRAWNCRLEFLPAAEVAAYVAGRLGGPVAAPLAAFVHARTEGNALFMVNLVEHLVQQELVVRREGQWTLRDNAADWRASPRSCGSCCCGALRPSRRRRGGCSKPPVWGARRLRWPRWRRVPSVRWRTSRPVCEGLAAQQHFLDDTGLTGWPDGTSGGSYRFRHAFYQQVLYERLGTRAAGAAAPAHWHAVWRRAMAPGRGTSPPSSPSTSSAGARSSVPCAISSRRQTMPPGGMPITKRSPPSPKDWRCWRPSRRAPRAPSTNSRCCSSWGRRLMAAKGYGAPEVGESYTRAHTLCQQVGEPRQRCQALQGLSWLSSCPGPGAHGWRVEPAVLPPGATPTRQDPGAGGLYGPGAYSVLSGRPGHGPGPSGAQSAPLRRPPVPAPSLHRWV